jgi:hypothetical protein
METLLTLAIILGVPFWLVAEELMHRFRDLRGERKTVKPPVTARHSKRAARQPMETSSHMA